LNAHNQSYGRWIVASEYVKHEAVRTGYDRERIDVVPYFTALPPAVTAPRPGRILFVGRLVREKGVDLFFDALSQLQGDWTCTVIGEGNASVKVREHAHARGLDGRVTFAGWLNGAALAEAFDDASVVVVPSRWPEPFGIVGIEAMAHARPVVAFRVGGIPEWMDDGVTGHLVEPGDVRALSQRLATVLEHPADAAAMGARGRARVERDYTAPTHLNALLPIYGQLHAGL
jgi:glycosyltransferase involved in cell wall biosynthesis